jgi:hypothetical protein
MPAPRKVKPRARIGCKPGCTRITLQEQCDAHRPSILAQLFARLMRKAVA